MTVVEPAVVIDAGNRRDLTFVVTSTASLATAITVCYRTNGTTTTAITPTSNTLSNGDLTRTIVVPFYAADTDSGRWIVYCDVTAADGKPIAAKAQPIEVTPRTAQAP